jgi:hypothetical protein
LGPFAECISDENIRRSGPRIRPDGGFIRTYVKLSAQTDESAVRHPAELALLRGLHKLRAT